MDDENSSRQSLIQESLDKLILLRDYKSNILDSIKGNTLNKPLADYYRLLEVFEADLYDCIILNKENDLTLAGESQMKWILCMLKVIL